MPDLGKRVVETNLAERERHSLRAVEITKAARKRYRQREWFSTKE